MIRWIEKNKGTSFVLALGISLLTVSAVMKHQRDKHMQELLLESQQLSMQTAAPASAGHAPVPLNVIARTSDSRGNQEITLSPKTKDQLEKEKKEAQIESLQIKKKIREVEKQVEKEVHLAQQHKFKIQEVESALQDIQQNQSASSSARMNAYADLRNQIFMSRSTPVAEKQKMLEDIDHRMSSLPADNYAGLDFKYEPDGSVIGTPKGN